MPLDVVRKRLQVQGPMRKEIFTSDLPRYKNALMAACMIFQHEGILGFYRGLTPSILKIAPSTAITFFVIDQCRIYFTLYNNKLLTKYSY
jgi:solute carrier family 25 thiamine pyrophosphate transporter 19